MQTSWSSGTVSSGTSFDATGGLVGLNNGIVQASFSSAAAFSSNTAGGLVGANQAVPSRNKLGHPARHPGSRRAG